MTDRLIITIREAAALLGLSESTVYRLARENKIPVVRIGASVRVNRARLVQMIPPRMQPESHYRDLFAAQYDGEIEVRVPFGRVDVVAFISLGSKDRWGSEPALGALAIEVEPIKTWQHGVRQALAYAMQLSEARKPYKYKPAVALYGEMSASVLKRIKRQTRRLCEVFIYQGDRWQHMNEVGE